MGKLKKVMEINMTLVSTDASKDTLEKYEEIWDKIRYLIGWITNNSDN